MPKILNKNMLKYIAAIVMVIDHVALFFINPHQFQIVYAISRLLGRLTIPIMCFFIAEGFVYTRSRFNYGLRLGIFALISQIAYTFAFQQTLLTWSIFTSWNVIYTLFIGYLILVVFEKIKNVYLKLGLMAILFLLSYIGDWGLFAPAWIFVFYYFKDKPRLKYLAFAIIALARTFRIYYSMINGQNEWYLYLWQIGVLFAIPLILMYNNQKGSHHFFHKYFFYILYPAHLVLLKLIVVLVLFLR